MTRRLQLFAALASLMAPVAAAADDEQDMLRDLQALQQPPTAASPETLRQIVDATLPKVAQAMGLSPPASVSMKVVSRDEARGKLLAILQRDYPGDTLSRLGELLTAVGLAEPGKDLSQEATAMYGQNVSGFYDPSDRVLYLLADQPIEAQMLIVAHELAHAVQDEHLRLDAAARDRRSSEDAQLAFSAAIEGQAQEVASEVMASQLSQAGLDMSGLSQMLSDSTASSAQMAGTQASVPWLGMQMSFPYAAGASFIAAVHTSDDKTARSILKRLPSSTAQVISPTLYQRDEKPRPGAIHLKDLLPGSTALYATTLGQANVDLFGQLHGGGELGEGWRGDQAEAVRLSGHTVAAWAVTFSTPDQAQRLAQAMVAAVHATPGTKQQQADESWYQVQTAGTTVSLLEGVPDTRVAAVQKAALAAFDH